MGGRRRWWSGSVAILLLLLLQGALPASGSKLKTVYACQGSHLALSCPPQHQIRVVRANYGRFSVAICNDKGITDWSVNCMAPRSLRIMQDRCNSEHECSILADSDIFGGDPCQGVPKYLEVYFGCFQESTTMTSSTGPPLPPWLTTRPPVSFFPGLRDLDIRPRVPFTVSQDSTELPSTVEETTSLPNNTSTEKEEKVVTVTEVVIEEESDVTTTEKSLVGEMMREDEKEEKAKEELRMTKAKEEMERRRKEEEQRREEQEREEERKRLAYSSFSSQEEEVRVHISTLAPAPSVAPHMDTISPLSMCPPRNIRALSWSWSRPGSTASLACPPGTTGSATWTCSSSSSGNSGTPQWATPSPDLSDCQSLWMAKIIGELRKSELILSLASELMQYVSANPLYGGDIKSAVNAMTIITEKMQYQLEKVPTVEQREAMVMELAQATVKTASSLLSPENLPAWQDLPTSQRSRFVSHLVSTLERAGSLLPASLPPDREASVSSTNVLLTVRRISFRNIHRTHLPSVASLATPAWRDYSDSVEVPALVLMENMQAEGAMLVFLSLKHMEELAGAPGGQSVTSQVVHLSLGGGQVVREPLAVTLEHSSKGGEARCVLWQPEIQNWNSEFCSTLESNLTHSTCHCSRLGTFALLQDQKQPGDEVARMNFLVTVIIAISVSIVFFVSIILAFIYCYRMKAHQQLKLRLGRADLPCLRQQKPWVLSDSPTITEDLFQAQAESYDVVRNSDFMVLSRASLASHESPSSGYHPGPQYTPGHQYQYTLQQAPVPGPQVHTGSRRQPSKSPHPYVTSSPTSLHTLACRVATPTSGPPSQHIYMEVDPLYCMSHEEGGDGGVHNCSGLHSSSSSQTSSGYSTAPSEVGKFAEYASNGVGGGFGVAEVAGSNQAAEYGVYSITQCMQHHRQIQQQQQQHQMQQKMQQQQQQQQQYLQKQQLF